MQIHIQLSARLVIDHTATGTLEKDIFNDSYNEFALLSQAYNPGGAFASFEQMKAANPKAHSLHYKVGFAVGLYLRSYGGMAPGVTDTLGNGLAVFENPRFEILASIPGNRSAHRVAIHFETPALRLLHHFGDYLVIELPAAADEKKQVVTVQLRPGLAVSSYVTSGAAY